jgi:hypothetical protein
LSEQRKHYANGAILPACCLAFAAKLKRLISPLAKGPADRERTSPLEIELDICTEHDA